MVCLHFTIDLWEAGEPDIEKSPLPNLGEGCRERAQIPNNWNADGMGLPLSWELLV